MNDLLSLIPAGYTKYVAALLFTLPYITRAIHALKNGGGVRGAWRGIWYGTNLPKTDANATK